METVKRHKNSSFQLNAQWAYKTPCTTIALNPHWKCILIYLQSAMCFCFFVCFVRFAICLETKLQTVTWNYSKLFDFQLEWHKTIIAFVGWFGLVWFGFEITCRDVVHIKYFHPKYYGNNFWNFIESQSQSRVSYTYCEWICAELNSRTQHKMTRRTRRK